MRILEAVIAKTGDSKAKLLLGCLLYNKRHYEKAAALWEECDDGISARNLAVAYDPKRLRRALHCYLNALIADFMGEEAGAQALIKESYSLNSENLSALTFKTQGFLP